MRCESQAEIDEYWSKLGEGGTELGCGWLKERAAADEVLG